MLRLYNGDAATVLKHIAPNTFDAVITDPPYSTDIGKSTAQKYTGTKRLCPYPDFACDNMDQRCWIGFMSDILSLARYACKDMAVCILFISWRQIPALSDALQRAGWVWRGVAVWDKGLGARPQLGRFRQQAEFVLWGSNGRMPTDRAVPVLPGVYQYPNVQSAERIHQTQKPVALMRDLMRICTPDSCVLDPFAGSGSTLAAARDLGFSATGVEMVKPIAEAAAKRLNIPLEVVP